MKKAQFLSFFLVICMVVLNGCTTQTPAPTEVPTTAVQPTTPAVAPTAAPTVAPTEVGVEGCHIAAPAQPVTINVIGWSYPIIDYYFGQLKKCNGVKNITVNTQMLDSGSAQDQIKLAAAAGGQSTYDIILDSGGLAQTLAEEGALVQMDDLIAKYDPQYNISKDIVGWPDATYNGHIYAIPLENNTELFFYRADLFQKYGLTAPDTWDDVIKDCTTLKADKTIDLPGTLTLYQGWAWDMEFSYFLGAQGVHYLDANNQPLFDGPEGVAALTKMVDVAKACNGDQGMTYSIDNTETALENGGIALAETWASRGANMDDATKSKFVGQINFSHAPRFAAGGPFTAMGGGASFSIMKGSKDDPDLLFQIIAEVTNYDSQVEAAKLGIASRQSVAKVATARYYAASIDTIANAVPSDYNPANGLASTALSNDLPLVWGGQMTIQQALDKAKADYIEQAKAAGYIK